MNIFLKTTSLFLLTLSFVSSLPTALSAQSSNRTPVFRNDLSLGLEDEEAPEFRIQTAQIFSTLEANSERVSDGLFSSGSTASDKLTIGFQIDAVEESEIVDAKAMMEMPSGDAAEFDQYSLQTFTRLISSKALPEQAGLEAQRIDANKRIFIYYIDHSTHTEQQRNRIISSASETPLIAQKVIRIIFKKTIPVEEAQVGFWNIVRIEATDSEGNVGELRIGEAQYRKLRGRLVLYLENTSAVDLEAPQITSAPVLSAVVDEQSVEFRIEIGLSENSPSDIWYSIYLTHKETGNQVFLRDWLKRKSSNLYELGVFHAKALLPSGTYYISHIFLSDEHENHSSVHFSNESKSPSSVEIKADWPVVLEAPPLKSAGLKIIEDPEDSESFLVQVELTTSGLEGGKNIAAMVHVEDPIGRSFSFFSDEEPQLLRNGVKLSLSHRFSKSDLPGGVYRISKIILYPHYRGTSRNGRRYSSSGKSSRIILNDSEKFKYSTRLRSDARIERTAPPLLNTEAGEEDFDPLAGEIRFYASDAGAEFSFHVSLQLDENVSDRDLQVYTLVEDPIGRSFWIYMRSQNSAEWAGVESLSKLRCPTGTYRIVKIQIHDPELQTWAVYRFDHEGETAYADQFSFYLEGADK